MIDKAKDVIGFPLATFPKSDNSYLDILLAMGCFSLFFQKHTCVLAFAKE